MKIHNGSSFTKFYKSSVRRTVSKNMFSDLTHSLSTCSKNKKLCNFVHNATEGKRHISRAKGYLQNTEIGKIIAIGLITKRNSILKQYDIFSEGRRARSLLWEQLGDLWPQRGSSILRGTGNCIRLNGRFNAISFYCTTAGHH